MNKTIAVLLTGAIATILLACAAPDNSVSQDSAVSDTVASQDSGNQEATSEPYTLHWIHQYTQDAPLIGTIEAVIDKYQKEVNPSLIYEAEYIPDTEAYYSKVKTLIASGEMPSMFWGDPDSFTLGLREQGLLYNVGELIDGLELSDRFLPITYEYPKYEDGSLYAMAVGANVSYFHYHKDMFEAAGITEKPTTWDDFFEACEKLKASGVTPIASSGDTWYILRWAAFIPYRMSGNAYIDSVVKGEKSWNSEEAVKMGEFAQKVTQYWPEGWAGIDSSTARDLFLSKQAAIWYYPVSTSIAYITDDNLELTDDYDYFLLPTLEGYDATAPTDCFANSGKGIFMSKEFMEDNEEEKKRFAKFFIENFGDAALEKHFSSGILPSHTENVSDFQQHIYDDFANVSPSDYAHCWDVVIDSVSNETLKAETINLFTGDITIDEWCSIMDKTIAENVGG